MVMKAENVAPCPPESEKWRWNSSWDCRPEMLGKEWDALRKLFHHYPPRGRNCWTKAITQGLSRLTTPLKDTLKWMHAAQAPRNSAIHNILLEMYRLKKTYWTWTETEWLEVICESEGDFHRKYGCHGNCRQYVIAIAWRLCGFDKLEKVGRFFQYRLAIKVYGRSATDAAVVKLQREMQRIGHSTRSNGVRNALCMAMLCQRQAELEKLELETLRRVIDAGPAYMRTSAATLSRILAGMGLLPEGIDHRVAHRKRPASEYRATDNVPETWLKWCERWRSTSTRTPSSILSTWYVILKCGRWLSETHPDIHSPADWTREIALEYVVAACKMRIGQWSEPGHMYREKRGQLMKPAARAGVIAHVRIFFRDLQEWDLIPIRFDPARVFRTPRSIRSCIGPAPRIVSDDIWCKLVWAGLNLQEQDLQYGDQLYYRYPFSMVRALCVLWLFGGLRCDEILRMRKGCIRWHIDEEHGGVRICLLDVPVNKTSTSFTKPADPVVGEYIDAWEKERCTQSLQEDRKTGEHVSYLFMHRGRRIHAKYINKSLIPLLCRKAGVPNKDARGPITSHRARATIASQLFNAKEPLGVFELQKWLGHASPESTRHYINITPTKLAGSLSKAGYFERNRRMVSVLVDQAAIKNGEVAEGAPWRYYDLGHGFCSYDFFEQCPHRMACVKYSFYIPKPSSKAQLLESDHNLQKMLQEIPLTEDERAAIDEGVEAVNNLIEKIKDIPAPDRRPLLKNH